MDENLISVIMPVYNGQNYIKDTIASLLKQTYKYFELIIIDDASIDKTVNIIESFVDSRIRLIKLDLNQGAANARNKGIKNAKGRFIAFLDCDDLLTIDSLEKQILYLKKNNYSFVFGSYEVKYKKSKKIHIVPDKVDYKNLLKTSPIKTFTVLIDRKVIPNISFPSKAKYREDLACWLNILKTTQYAYGNKEIVGQYRIRSNSISSNKFKMIYYQFNIYFGVEEMGLFKSIFYLINWAYYGYMKYYSNSAN